ncbi:hypothetical protein SKAU_G00315350 [Synaphobranchus kaupii]|uniref:Retinal cone rhodopsin-sensitive cGMP 3',5'-cyclic phosphodiesterase subunit gamma n=1 Tax=Synaphobranchus kaupii TaxID=118154 RepID=A0A9Q1ESI0_SYNKA|nr:hypothetical protein SKAU_G00315350 [Synaphobranchus kaupii]
MCDENFEKPEEMDGQTRTFKSNAPTAGGKGFAGGIPGMDGLGAANVVCPWETYGEMDMNDLAAFGIV